MKIGPDKWQVNRLAPARAAEMGFSGDPRRRRRQHRRAARNLLNQVGFFASGRQRGTGMNAIARWHLAQARFAVKSW